MPLALREELRNQEQFHNFETNQEAPRIGKGAAPDSSSRLAQRQVYDIVITS
jgi:hypothetical protein